jgi:SAM-dependent methyltransferase
VKRFTFRPAPTEYDDEFIDTMADAYREQTAWTRLRLAAIEDLVEPQAGDRALDLGCTAGAVTHFLSTFGCDAFGVDAEPRAIERARDLYPELSFEVADVAELPFTDSTFDKAVAADLVEHLDDSSLEGMLSEAYRVLRPGGTLSIYTPNRELVLAQNPTHIGLRPAQVFVDALKRTGFVVDRNEWRASFFPVFRTVERAAGRWTSFMRYRLCLRGRRP